VTTAPRAPAKRPGRPILSTYVDWELKELAHAVAAERNTTVSELLRDSLTLMLTGDGATFAVLSDDNTNEERKE
jgi:hypothetical protein